MIERREGTIINMASIAGRIPITPNSVYCASKHGLVALSQTLRYELSRYNIEVHVVCPGRVVTPFFDHETFRNRLSRAETRYTASMKDVSRATLRAIGTRKFMIYVPRTMGWLAWALNGTPWLTKPLLDHLMAARMRSYYDVGSTKCRDGRHGSG
jgi:short-subunit dehydrogenase